MFVIDKEKTLKNKGEVREKKKGEFARTTYLGGGEG